MIVLNSLFPIFVLLLLGWILKQKGFTTRSFLSTVDKLIYFIFFPVMLFWKIGGSSSDQSIDWNFCIATFLSLCVMFLLSLVVITLCRVSSFQAGTFSQSCYRHNTYIGMIVVLNSFGNEGVKYFGIILAFAIPLLNVFAVNVLNWFSGRDISFYEHLSSSSKALVANPLILGCFAGILYARLIGWFPVFIDNSISMISLLSLPLALLSIGGSLTFKGVKDNLFLSLVAAGLKLVILPVIGCLFYILFGVTGVPFKVGLIFFALPASTAIYIISSQMNSDTQLASSAIVISTMLSFLSISVVLLL